MSLILVETVVLQDSACYSRVPGPATSALSENSLEMEIPDSTPNLLNQKLGTSQAVCVFKSPSGASELGED